MISGYQGMSSQQLPGNVLVGATGAAVGGTVASLTPLLFGAAAGPIGIAIGTLVAAAGALASAFGVGSGCGPDCIKATQIVNQAEPILRDNLNAYMSGQIDKGTAIGNFQQIMSAVNKACASVPGGAGANCSGDRQDGACKWKDASGQCWNWYTGYYWPIMNDTSVRTTAATSTASTIINNLTGGLTSSIDPLTMMLFAGIGLLAIGMVD